MCDSIGLHSIGLDLGSRCPIGIALSATRSATLSAMASSEMTDKAGTALAEAAGADAKVILFGSHARGEERPDSDLDFLVIEPEVSDHFGESVRLARLVGELGVPADVVVASEDHVREWGALGHDDPRRPVRGEGRWRPSRVAAATSLSC